MASDDFHPPSLPPHLIVLGGPNGAGKSTTAPHLLRDELGVADFVNTDVIVGDAAGFDAEETSIGAGRVMLAKIHDQITRRQDMAFLSTLASQSLVGVIRGARARHYRISIVFLWLSGPELAVARVRERALLGGHSVPEEIIRRQYHRGIEHFFRMYRPLANAWRFYDNSGTDGPKLIARGADGSGEEIIDGTTWQRARADE